MSADLHQVGLGLLITASILSLLFVVAKALGKEFQEVALVWIRVVKRLKAELRKPLTIEKPSQPPPP